MSYTDLNVRHGQGDEAGVLWIELARPQARNAITQGMVESLEQALREADADDRVRVVLLGAQGDSFCAGGDVKDMLDKKGMFAGGSAELRQNYKRGIQRIPQAMEAFSKPIIALVDGPAVGAGCDLACMADLRIGTDKAQFMETFARLALVPGDGGTFFLPRVIGYPRAMEMFLTGRMVKGEEALQWGLLNRLVKSEELKAEGLRPAKQILEMAPIAVRMTKEALKRSRLEPLSSQLDLLSTYQGITQRTADHEEGLKALKEKRPPRFQGA